MNWISDFVDLDGVNLRELINRFTLSTAEVEDIYEYGTDIKDVVAAKILTVEDHPESKKLHILTVDDGTGSPVQVVCGAPNVHVGMVVPFARVGGIVKGQAIGKAKLAGVDSFGMCCSQRELGISEEHGGLMELPQDSVLGRQITDIYPLVDTIFEVDNKSLTNRPDLWGHYGIAREIAALTGRQLKPIDQADTKAYESLPPVAVAVADGDKCRRYTSVIIKNIKEHVSPVPMQIRLTYCGMRPLNLLADLTNYIMLEIGQPMHAFDYKLVNGINVRTFDKPFEFETLDNTVRNIPADTLMICDAKGEPVCIAGIMGGLATAINDDTDTVLLESATFDGVSIRKVSTALGHRTEASARYEKELDPELNPIGIRRFIKLVSEIDVGAEVAASVTDVYPKPYPTIKLSLAMAYIDKYTGIAIDNDTILNTLIALGFNATLDNDAFSVTVPSWRATKDVSINADMIEEITRIYGYDNFEIKTTSAPLCPVRHSMEREDEYAAKLFLAREQGLHEVHSYLWYNNKVNKELGIEVPDNVKIRNSVSPDTGMLRGYLAPTLLQFAQVNKAHSAEFGLFEIGKAIKGMRADNTCNERKVLGILSAAKGKSEKDVFYRVKTAVEGWMKYAKNITPSYQAIGDEQSLSWVHPYNSLTIMVEGKAVGYITSLHPTIKANLDKKLSVTVAELDFDTIAAMEPKPVEYRELSRFPGVDIDLSLLVDKDIPYAQLDEKLSTLSIPHLLRYSLVDVYDDATDDKKSITARFYFGSMEKTLSGDEVESATQAILSALNSMGITLR